MAAYAAWPDGKPPTVSITLAADEPLRFADHLPLDAIISSTGGDITVSRFLEPSQGIAFEVRDAKGVVVCPAESPPWSPPPPPPNDQTTVLVTPSTPYRTRLYEAGKWVFPGPGTYSVRAVLTLWGPGAEGAAPRYTAVSSPLVVDVLP